MALKPNPTIPDPNAFQIGQTKNFVVRETIESLAVAFILALLFKAFIAEAFVIPTGSMAPTLMGAHKDIQCDCCGYQYQCGASEEFSHDTGVRTNRAVIATICPLCRKPQAAVPSRDANQATFSGDRILVSKLAYVWNRPRRWDVIVFKFIENARLNYIKRCLGLPGEAVRIHDGDVYTRDSNENGPYEIVRKPPHVLNAMLQIVNDTKHRAKDLLRANVPDAWQTQRVGDDVWQLKSDENEWQAVCKNNTGTDRWLRYYHRVVELPGWEQLRKASVLNAPVDPRQPRLILDFTAYNHRFMSFAMEPSVLEAYVKTFDFMGSLESTSSVNRLGNDGLHWAGDLASEFEVQSSSDATGLSLLLVEAGVEHTVTIDLKTGIAKATVQRDGQLIDAFLDGEKPINQVTASGQKPSDQARECG
jgi:signal peptidase I